MEPSVIEDSKECVPEIWESRISELYEPGLFDLFTLGMIHALPQMH